MMEIRHPRFNAFGTIDCEILGRNGQWGPYTASPDDVEPYGREVYAAASQMEIAPYVAPDLPPATPEQHIAICRAAIQYHIDTTARAHLYDNGNSMASYVASTNAQWASEAQAFVAWRDAVWTHVYALWDNPPEPWPTADDVVASLPIFSLGE